MFINFLNKTIANNLLLYKIWFYGVRTHKGDDVRLPDVNDNFYFDGYPRSGNTYHVGLLKSMFPQKNFTSHLHSIGGLKIALKLGLPIFVIIRSPQDAVISNIYRKTQGRARLVKSNLIKNKLISYYNYYAYVNKHIEDMNILNFNTCINNGPLFLKSVANVLGFEIVHSKSLDKIVDKYQRKLEKKERQKKNHISSLPNQKRIQFKEQHLSKVLNSPQFDRAQKIYTDLIEKDILSNQ